MNSAAAYRYRRSDLLSRYPNAPMYTKNGISQNRSQALCIMNFRSFSMFDLAESLSSRKMISSHKSSDDRSNAHKNMAHRDIAHKDITHKDIAHKSIAHKSNTPKNIARRSDTHRNNARRRFNLRNDSRDSRLMETRRPVLISEDSSSRSSFQIMVDRKVSAAGEGKPLSTSCTGPQVIGKYVRRSIRSPRKMISAGKLSVMAAVILLLLTMSLILSTFKGSAADVRAGIPLSEVQYKVVEIKYGDTLWSIARNNMNPGYTNIKDYISDIKDCNQMSSDNLTTGGYLMIPYYEYVRDDTL